MSSVPEAISTGTCNGRRCRKVEYQRYCAAVQIATRICRVDQTISLGDSDKSIDRVVLNIQHSRQAGNPSMDMLDNNQDNHLLPEH